MYCLYNRQYNKCAYIENYIILYYSMYEEYLFYCNRKHKLGLDIFRSQVEYIQYIVVFCPLYCLLHVIWCVAVLNFV